MDTSRGNRNLSHIPPQGSFGCDTLEYAKSARSSIEVYKLICLMKSAKY